MAFEKNNFNVARKGVLEKRELIVECNVQSGEKISKVLAVSVAVGSLNSEVLNGAVNFFGTIDTKVVVLGEEQEINSVCASCPFSSRFEGSEIDQTCSAQVDVKIVDYVIDSTAGEMVKILVTLEQSGFIIENQEVSSVRPVDESVCTKNEDISVIRYLGSASEDIVVESEINVRDNIKKILLAESSVVVKNIESGVNFVTMTGEVVSRVLYLNENDKFESGYVYEGFKQEVELAGASRDSLVEGCAHVKYEGIENQLVDDGKGAKLLIKVPVVLNVRAYDNEIENVVCDLYSTKGEVKVSTSSFNMTEVCPLELIEGKIDGSLTLDENYPRVDKVLFNGGNNATITNSYIKDKELFIEGIAKTSVVYLNDETSSLHSVSLEIPFTISEKTNASEDSRCQVHAIVCDVDVSVRKGREFYYDAKIKASVNCCQELLSGVISNAELIEEDLHKDYAMEIVFAPKGKTLWDIAKASRVKEEQIVAQNPEVVFPTTEDTPIVLFEQRVQ